ncbi:hypothetical protein EV175_003774 [Coemansia sp. RSA 1933]|nr:hypothetical protein EV175_003774 [Coemansia sp. RSA 1933]
MSTTTNPGIPVSIHTANTNSSNALSSGLPSEQRIHADTQQYSSSQQAAAVADTPLAHPNTGDFAEWVFTDNTQETSSSRNNSNYSVGSMVHVSGSLAAIEEASDSSQQRSRSSIGISKQTVIKEPPSQAKATSSAAEFDDAFGSLQISASPKPLSAKADDIGDSKQIDLDTAFNIPQAPLTSKAKDMSFEDVFGPADVFKPSEHNDEAKKSPQMARLGDTGSPLITRSSGHRRGASVGVPESPSTRAKSVEFAAGEKSGSGNSSNGSDADEDADTSFRVNFSIREKAIKDNPDESKAALSRVTTLLRSAPSTRRGRNRRDVRTMYVPSSAPITNAIETQGSQDAIGGKDGSGSTAQDSGTPITPMPVRPETTTEAEADTKQSEAQDADAQLEKARDIPVATETLPDTAAVAEADIAAVSTAETITSAPLAEESPSPVDISEEPKSDDILPPSTAPAAGPEAAEINETADALPSSNEIPPSSQPPTQTQKGEGSGRRRAPPPPPPPPAAPVVQQQIAASSASNASAETKIDTSLVEADTLEHQIQNQSQLTSSKSMHRGRRAGVSTGPPPISMNVREIIDYEVAIVHKPGVGDALQCIYQATGEVSMHIQDAINPLELAPLRVGIKRAEDGMDLVANPSVAVLDTSFTATVADGRDWYRFVRPNLFAQVKGPEGTDVVVFKYMMKGVSGSLHNVPIVVRQAESHTDGVYGMLAFYEPNVNSKFAGSTVSELALMLSMSGNLTLEASRPTASWYQEHNRLLWKLGDLSVPSADQAESIDSSILSHTLAMKARGDGSLMVDSIALRFVVHGSKIVDTALCIARVAAAASTSHQPNQQAAVGSSGSSMPATVVIDGPASFTIRSGKCIYKGLSGSHRPELPHEQEDEGGEDDSKSEAASSSEEEEAWASDEGGNNDSNSDDDNGVDSNAKGK